MMAPKVYTSNEFKRERENFISLCKNLERADTRKWLSEVLEVLFRDRGAEEKKVLTEPISISRCRQCCYCCAPGREQEAGERDRETCGSHTEGEGDPSEERGK